MIAPLTGNGMSMAFESARLASGPLLANSEGRLSWGEAAQAVAAQCDRKFNGRLFWAHWLQRAFFHGRIADSVFWLGARSPWFWRQMFLRTR